MKMVRVLWVAGVLAVLHPPSVLAQWVQVPCEVFPPPDPGEKVVVHQGDQWVFPVTIAYVGRVDAAGLRGRYAIAPNPVSSFWKGNSFLRWYNPGYVAACYQRVTPIPTGGVVISYLQATTNLLGYFERQDVPGEEEEGEEEGCDYQIMPDPSQCDPDDDPGGGGDDPPPPSGGTNMCQELQLEPGCYDVYVDDVKEGFVCCF